MLRLENNIMEYVDTRGVWPVYIRGQYAIELQGYTRNIPVNIARQVAFEIRNGIEFVNSEN